MITENQIEKAAQECVAKALEEVSFRCAADVKVGAELGINHFLDGLWHPMSEKPEMGSEILIRINKKIYEGTGLNPNDTFVHDYDYHDDWEHYANDARYLQWLYIDNLLKGGAE